MKKTRIYMGIPSTGQREDIQVYLFRDLQERYGDKIEMVFPDQCIHRTFHDFSRNEIVDEFLASDCDILWFLDSDVCPPKHVLDIVTVHGDKWQVAGSPYPLWMVPPGGDQASVLFTTYKGLANTEDGSQRGIVMSECPPSGYEFVDAIATGCMFIKREVFAQLEQPYFEFKFDPKTRRIKEGEDLGFCLKLSDKGIKCFIDYGTVCKHYKRVCLLDVQNYATSWANGKILSYDKEIRQNVQKAVTAAMEAGYERGLKEGMAMQSKKTPVSQSGLILPSNFAR